MSFLEQFRKPKRDPELVKVDKEMEKQIAEFESKKKNILALKKSHGWKEYEKFMEDRIEMLRRKRDYLIPGSDEDIDTKAYIIAYQDILAFSDNWDQ